MNETLFFVLGLALVAIALVASFVGLRFDKFPASRGLLVAGTLAVAAVVLGTMTFAWLNAEDEQEHREAELAEAVEANEEEGNTVEADEEAGSAAAEAEQTTPAEETTTAEEATASVDGAQVFATAGCTGCHTLADAGSTGTTGPDLDGALEGQSEAFIRESIIDPNAEVADSFPPDVMPQTYGDDLSPEELDALVAYLAEATSGKG